MEPIFPIGVEEGKQVLLYKILIVRDYKLLPNVHILAL